MTDIDELAIRLAKECGANLALVNRELVAVALNTTELEAFTRRLVKEGMERAAVVCERGEKSKFSDFKAMSMALSYAIRAETEKL